MYKPGRSNLCDCVNSLENSYMLDLPNDVKLKLENFLNENHRWRLLSFSWVKCSKDELTKMKRSNNPSRMLLTKWNNFKLTPTVLFRSMYKVKLYEGLLILAPYVPHRYYHLIKDLEKKNKLPPSEFTSGRKVKYEPPSFLNVAHFPNEDISEITDNWNENNIISDRGTFGTSFHGVWKNQRVVVKKLEIFHFSAPAFNMVHFRKLIKKMMILNIRAHANIIRFVGFNINISASCLISEYMTNGSLNDRLKQGQPFLNWQQRIDIGWGTVNGLHFLHTFFKDPVIHGNLRSSNILLDNNLQPKLGDFNLGSHLKDENINISINRKHGLRPYLPEEFMKNRVLTTKVDSYSFGVVSYEMATGQPAFNEERQFIQSYIRRLSRDEIIGMCDSNAGTFNEMIFSLLINVGNSCTAETMSDVPEIESVLQRIAVACNYRS